MHTNYYTVDISSPSDKPAACIVVMLKCNWDDNIIIQLG